MILSHPTANPKGVKVQGSSALTVPPDLSSNTPTTIGRTAGNIPASDSTLSSTFPSHESAHTPDSSPHDAEIDPPIALRISRILQINHGIRDDITLEVNALKVAEAASIFNFNTARKYLQKIYNIIRKKNHAEDAAAWYYIRKEPPDPLSWSMDDSEFISAIKDECEV